MQFESEEERADYISKVGKPVGDNTEHEGKPAIFYSIVGELAKKSAQDASKYYNLRVNLDADYIVGKNWAECH